MTPDAAYEIVYHLAERAAQLPERGKRFGASVVERAWSIMETINRTGRVTKGQADSLNNMSLGVEKWFHDRELAS